MDKNKPGGSKPKSQYRYGIAEWYGRPFLALTEQERRNFAQLQKILKKARPAQACPFQSRQGHPVACNKEGGVCSLRLYERRTDSGLVRPASGELAHISTTCPSRFEEDQTIYRWVSETILGCENPLVVAEVGFLERPRPEAGADTRGQAGDDVGRIDRVLVVPNSKPLAWCALEVQAVYFQGRAMKFDFENILQHSGQALPFPAAPRRPDYRSSGPKRLMPQLQIKVPSLRRWGKKMAVVVDRAFFGAMGKMDVVKDVSNCDVAWFVASYDESSGGIRLRRGDLHLTTLERSVEGLTAGTPVTLDVFEQRIISKLQRLPQP